MDLRNSKYYIFYDINYKINVLPNHIQTNFSIKISILEVFFIILHCSIHIPKKFIFLIHNTFL